MANWIKKAMTADEVEYELEGKNLKLLIGRTRQVTIIIPDPTKPAQADVFWLHDALSKIRELWSRNFGTKPAQFCEDCPKIKEETPGGEGPIEP